MTPILFFLFFRRIGFAIFLVETLLIFILILFEFFRLSNDFSFFTAIGIALLNAPQFLIITMPFACAIGAALAMQKMVLSNEMAVLRSSGLSPLSIMTVTMITSLGFIGTYLITSEFILSPASQLSQSLRHDFKVLNALWLHEDNSYIRVEKLLANGEMQNVIIYNTKKSEVEKIITAKSARQTDDTWTLYDVKVFENKQDRFIEQQHQQMDWQNFSISATDLNAFAQKPRHMSISQALLTSKQIGKIGQNNSAFIEVLGQHFLTLPALPLLAASSLWFIGGFQRKKSMAIPLFLSLCIATGFFFFSQITIKFSILDSSYYLIPTSLAFLIGVIFLAAKRQS